MYSDIVRILKDNDNCTWKPDENSDTGLYETDCGGLFYFEDGTPTDHRFKFCPYCGRNLLDIEEWHKGMGGTE